ncbi:hypothetical protein M1O51_00760 [Dehalococcoidia bacterium]|nr:hypothetical protein [Dehalococcoidia bacterium]
MKLKSSRVYDMAKRSIGSVLQAVPANLWVFFSGVVAGLGANVFTTRALSGEGITSAGWMWLEFAIFLMSSAFGIAAGAVRRQIWERWRKGGGHPNHEILFLMKEIGKLTTYAALALLSLVGGLLMVFRG